MKTPKRLLRFMLDVVEIYFPSALFLALFFAFILQIVSRYIFQNPLVWPYELAQISYLWVILLGTGLAARTDSNIVFSVVYEACPTAVRKVFHVISHLMIIVFFLACVPSLLSFYQFFFGRYSSVFRLPLGIVFFGFAIFVVVTVGRSVLYLWQCLHKLLKHMKEISGQQKGEKI